MLVVVLAAVLRINVRSSYTALEEETPETKKTIYPATCKNDFKVSYSGTTECRLQIQNL